MSKLIIRDMVEEDRSLIMNSWLRSYRKSPDSNLYDTAFFASYRPIAEYLLKRAQVKVVVPEGDENLILAYMVCEPGVLHWIYVKRDFRKQGIAKLLLKSQYTEDPVITFTTPLGRKRLKLKYRPKVLRQRMNGETNGR